MRDHWEERMQSLTASTFSGLADELFERMNQRYDAPMFTARALERCGRSFVLLCARKGASVTKRVAS